LKNGTFLQNTAVKWLKNNKITPCQGTFKLPVNRFTGKTCLNVFEQAKVTKETISYNKKHAAV